MAQAGSEVPYGAKWLGGFGLIPFVASALGLPFLAPSQQIVVAHALVAYGASILSFLGGVQWGLAIAYERDRAKPDGAPTLAVTLGISVVPSLIAWSALMLPTGTALWILAIAIAALLAVDLRLSRIGIAPAWYPSLRMPLTGAVVASLLLGALTFR